MKFDTVRAMRNQHGAVLIVSLIMLAVMTLFVISMLKTSILELKIGGSSQAAALNFANAELAISNFIAANNGRFAPGFITQGLAITTLPTFRLGNVVLTPAQVACGPDPGTNKNQVGAFDVATYNVRSVATDGLGGETTLVQGIWSYAPAGAC